MTKRFTYVKNNSISQYSVLPIQEISGKTYHCQGIVDKLNKLSDENEQLKQDIEYYKTERKALFEFIDKKDDLDIELKLGDLE